jgi:hypothetical protein
MSAAAGGGSLEWNRAHSSRFVALDCVFRFSFSFYFLCVCLKSDDGMHALDFFRSQIVFLSLFCGYSIATAALHGSHGNEQIPPHRAAHCQGRGPSGRLHLCSVACALVSIKSLFIGLLITSSEMRLFVVVG